MTNRADDDPVARIESAVLQMLRRANDPRGNRWIYEMAGTDIERAGAVMLARVEEHQPARVSVLADAVGLDLSTASRQVGRLVEQGYVERAQDPQDRRATLHRLTPAGTELRGRLADAVTAWFERALAEFDGEDRAHFAELISRFVEGISAADDL